MGATRDRHLRRPSQPGNHAPVHPPVWAGTGREAGARHGGSARLACCADGRAACARFALMAVEAGAERAFTTGVGPTYFTAQEWAEVTAAVAPGALGLRSMHTRRTLTRLFALLDQAGASLGFPHHTIYRVQSVVLHAMWMYRTAWGKWVPDTW